MKVGNKNYRTIWLSESDDRIVRIINQLALPHCFETVDLECVEEACFAIKEMQVRGAGLIGATAAFGMYLATLQAGNETFDQDLTQSGLKLKATRPTASNLAWAVDRMLDKISAVKLPEEKRAVAKTEAQCIADEDAEFCRKIGEHGKAIIEEISARKEGGPVNVLTHCNAGWLAFVDHGSATAPIYAAHDSGIKIHVWVDETRPRNQGASLTCWELGQHGVPHTLVTDNLGGHLMQHGLVDMVLVGTDRTTRSGDVANKIGTYLKALAAKDNGVPFYVALPSSTFDFEIRDGLKEIPIEERAPEEVTLMSGLSKEKGEWTSIRHCPPETEAKNWGFDVTPARLVEKLICERGLCDATEEAILGLFPEKRNK